MILQPFVPENANEHEQSEKYLFQKVFPQGTVETFCKSSPNYRQKMNLLVNIARMTLFVID